MKTKNSHIWLWQLLFWVNQPMLALAFWQQPGPWALISYLLPRNLTNLSFPRYMQIWKESGYCLKSLALRHLSKKYRTWVDITPKKPAPWYGKAIEMPYELIDHTADTGIRVWAPEPEQLFSEACQAMFEQITDTHQLAATKTRSISVEGFDL